MIRKTEVTFYDTYSYTGEPPNIKLTPDKFYGGFALGNPLTLETFVDNTIYTVSVIFMDGQKINGQWNFIPTPLKLETCSLERFGENYRDIFKTKSMEKMHCVPFLNHTLRGHLTYDFYSYYLVRFTPCINSTLNNFHCKPLSTIRKYLTQTFVTFKMEDIDLTPQDYHNPVVLRGKEVSATVGKNLFQDVHSFFQVVNIETDLDWFGFDEMEDIKTETFLKYDELIAMSNIIEEDIYQTGAKFCDATIKLAENVRTQRRVYVKLITILGDIGGLMEVLFTLFRVISSFSIDILYEISMVNRLFNFDLEKREVILKEPKVEQTHRLSIFKSQEKIEEISKIPFEEKEKKEENEKIAKKSINYKMTRKPNYKRSIYKNDSVNTNMANSKSKAFSRESRASISRRTSKAFNDQFDESGNKRRIIDKVRLNRACVYFLFCFTRRRKILANVLLNEGMDIISSKLDIFNIFDKMYQAEHVNIPMLQKQFPMSRDCKIALKFVRLDTSADASKKYRNSKSSRSSRSSSIYS